MKSHPHRCSLPGPELSARIAQIQSVLERHGPSVKQTKDGYRFELSSEPEILEEVAALVAAEKKCCAFLSFSIEVPTVGPIVVDVRERDRTGQKAWKKALLGAGALPVVICVAKPFVIGLVAAIAALLAS